MEKENVITIFIAGMEDLINLVIVNNYKNGFLYKKKEGINQ
jgi:hypothetical protein